MKPALLIGLLLIFLGIGALAYQGISYKTHEKILDIGPVEATSEKTETIPIPPFLSVLAVVGGVVIVVATARNGATTT